MAVSQLVKRARVPYIRIKRKKKQKSLREMNMTMATRFATLCRLCLPKAMKSLSTTTKKWMIMMTKITIMT